MGQYHLVANLDRGEYLHPHRMGDGMKLMEFGNSAGGTMLGLAVLLAGSNGRGGGDLHIWVPSQEDFRGMTPMFGQMPEGIDEEWVRRMEQCEILRKRIVGRWAGERIAIVGDYYEDGDIPTYGTPGVNLYQEISDSWWEISHDVMLVLRMDFYFRTDQDKMFDEYPGIRSMTRTVEDIFPTIPREATA